MYWYQGGLMISRLRNTGFMKRSLLSGRLDIAFLYTRRCSVSS